MHPIPTLDQAYSIIVQEESQRMSSSMLQCGILGSTPLNAKSSALIKTNAFNMRPRKNIWLLYDYYKNKGHSRKSFY